MKKLLIASMAAAVTAGAWAADLTKTQQGFEDDSFNLSDNYWSYPTEAETSALTVTEYEADEAYTYATTGDNVAAFSGPGSKYLHLETESGVLLQRMFAKNSGEVTVDADNSYVVDTLVKFTATDEAPTVDTISGDKFILWLKSTESEDGETTTYSLMATCGKVDDMGGITGNGDIALNAKVTPESWARVSVKVIATGSFDGNLGFVVYVNGVAVSAADTSEYAEFFADSADNYNAEAKARRAEYKLLPCLITGNSSQTLTSVGFEGTGSIDDLMIVAASDDDAPSFTRYTPSATTYTVSFKAVGLPEATEWSITAVEVTSGGTVATQTAPEVSGYEVAGWYSDETCETAFVFGDNGTTISSAMTIYVKYTATVTPVAPGETVTGYTSEDAATAALTNAGIANPFTDISSDVKDAYAKMFEAKATQTEDGTWTATWELTSDAETTLTETANDALDAVLDNVLNSEATTATITDVQPGFYYAVLSSATVDAEEYTANTWTQATSATVSLTLPTKDTTATQGFYKVGVSAVKPSTDNE